MTEEGVAPTQNVQAQLRARPRAALAAVAPGLFGAVLVFGLLLLLVEIRWSPLLRVDDAARDGLNGYALGHLWFVTAMKAVSAVASAWGWDTVLVAVVAWSLFRRRTHDAVYVVVTAALSPLLNDAVKALVHRSRPVLHHPVAHAPGLSFPSGHAQSAVVGVSLLLVLCWPSLAPRSSSARWAVAGVGVAVVLVIGLSRVALGVHYLSDVLAGYSLGTVWFALMTGAFGMWPSSGGAVRVRGVTRLPVGGRRP